MSGTDKGKKIRDPLYGFIRVSPLEQELIDTRVFQRLRRIQQLPFESLVYPSAGYTRFEHSLGTMHVASTMADKLKVALEERKLVRVAALLHDIGHGPFSHTFETIMRVLGKSLDHEEITRQLITNPTGEIQPILGSFDVDPNKVVSLLSKKTVSAARQIVTGLVDADKIDYLRRDSYHCGVDYGKFDHSRLIDYLIKVEERQGVSYLAVDERAIDALWGFVLARYFMHRTVYEHRVRIITDAMITKATRLARDYLREKLKLAQRKSNPKEFLKAFASLNDVSFLALLRQSEDKNVVDTVDRFERRKLWKIQHESPMGKSFREKVKLSEQQVNRLLAKGEQVSSTTIWLPELERELQSKFPVSAILIHTRDPKIPEPNPDEPQEPTIQVQRGEQPPHAYTEALDLASNEAKRKQHFLYVLVEERVDDSKRFKDALCACLRDF